MTTRTRFVGAESFLPARPSLPALAEAVPSCEGCDLYEHATQAVFGQGPASAKLMLVGEQPGDQEDLEGAPFVGPAGRLLARALADAQLTDTPTYITNAVKHFRWKPARSGKRRIHDKPSAAHATACRPWLAAELHAVEPAVLVALGATAAASLFGPAFRLTQHRGDALTWPPASGPFADTELRVGAALATIHPSAVLRAPDEDREAAYRGFVEDLAAARALLK